MRAKDPQLESLLEVRVGVIDKEVESILQYTCQQEDAAKIDLSATVIICSKRAQCTMFKLICRLCQLMASSPLSSACVRRPSVCKSRGYLCRCLSPDSLERMDKVPEADFQVAEGCI